MPYYLGGTKDWNSDTYWQWSFDQDRRTECREHVEGLLSRYGHIPCQGGSLRDGPPKKWEDECTSTAAYRVRFRRAHSTPPLRERVPLERLAESKRLNLEEERERRNLAWKQKRANNREREIEIVTKRFDVKWGKFRSWLWKNKESPLFRIYARENNDAMNKYPGIFRESNRIKVPSSR